MSKNLTPEELAYFISNFSTFDPDDIKWNEIFQEEDEAICECGSEKVYGKNTTHSHWCPKKISSQE